MPATESSNRRFSEASEVKALKPAATVYEASDATHKGLRLRVRPTGAKSWWYVYRERGTREKQGQIRRVPLGTYPATSLTKAREAWSTWQTMRASADKPDPHEHIAQEQARKAAQAEQEAASATQTVWTVRRLGDAFLAALTASKRRPRTIGETKRQLAAYVYPQIGDVPAHEVDTDLIERKVLRTLQRAGKARMHDAVRVTLVGMWSWATRTRKRKLAGEPPPEHMKGAPNPAAAVQVMEEGRHVGGDGDGVLRDRDLAALWRALTSTPGTDPYLDALAVQLATGQRIGETVSAQWKHVDLDSGTWTIPGTVTKNHHPQRVLLSAQAVAILKARNGRAGYVFPLRSTRDGKQQHARIDTANKRLRDVQDEIGIAAPITTHGLRKTMLTHVCGEALAYAEGVRQRIANHMPRDVLQATYVRETWDGKAREAWNAWGAFLDALLVAHPAKEG